MNMTIRLTAALLLATSLAVAMPNEKPNDLIQMGAYVASDDMTGSEAFYTTLFGQEPVIRLDNFVAFDVAGGIFAIAKRDVYAPDSSQGTGAVPYIHTIDLAAVQQRIERATGRVAPEVIVEPGIQILKITDPNGQVVEFFSLTN